MTTIRLSVIDILAQLPTRPRVRTIIASHCLEFSRHLVKFYFWNSIIDNFYIKRQISVVV